MGGNCGLFEREAAGNVRIGVPSGPLLVSRTGAVG
jgi:hypothetical protein